jgi:membrane-bound inhibitor of C-type lysozyme
MIVQGQTTSFKEELYKGVHNFTTDTFKIALYTANATLNQDTIAYTATGEISGAGYTATGQTLLNPVVSSASGVAYISFDNISWTSASFTVRGALIYNSSKANRSVAVLDFGSDKVTTSTFTITFPANTATSAIIRSSN